MHQTRHIAVITLFPDMFKTFNAEGIIGRALKALLAQMEVINLRSFGLGKHQVVDDKPYGGGPGMLLMPEPLLAAIRSAKHKTPDARVIHLSPQGKLFNHQAAERFSQQKSLIFVCGRYEGIDQRVIDKEIDEEWSIGDYVLTGGELAAMVIIDATLRLVEGCLGDQTSASSDTLATGLLKHPQYTRPEVIEQAETPGVLLSGNHAQIQEWRLKQSLGRTWLRRPDLLKQKNLSSYERDLLNQFIQEYTPEI